MKKIVALLLAILMLTASFCAFAMTAGEASANSAYMGFTISNAYTWGRIAGENAAEFAQSK